MGRFECDDEDFPGRSALWEQSARNAIAGKRGQAFLRELEAALLAMKDRRLCEGLVTWDGDVCAIGQMSVQRAVQAGKDRAEVIEELIEEHYDCDEWGTLEIAESLGMPSVMAQYLAFENDECRVWHPPLVYRVHPTPEQRWEVMLNWVRRNLREVPQ